MADTTVENVASAVTPISKDWKAVATLLFAVLVFVSGIAWAVSGNILRGATRELETNSKKISVLESANQTLEQKQIVVDKRVEEILVEIRAMNTKVGTVAESQARMEGYILGKK